ncbi:MAG: cyclophilin-like superfamily protein [Rhodobacteraceae bacterium]|nr:cyclophilin-like superfamily protein [Paracoccaceae bacterium]MAY47252.1 cyclophilin-like superfamily protein [Paracoccaceae bacterium]
MTDTLTVTIDGHDFTAVLHPDRAPETCKAMLARLPFRSKVVHVRWSGEAIWMPLGDMDFGVGYEDATSHPAPGQMILYPGGVSETEILLAYGGVAFASKAGPLAGNHFLTITGDLDKLAELGRKTLWDGALDVEIHR